MVQVTHHDDEERRFQRSIAQEYYRHLCWIQQESAGADLRCRWLWNILDHLAEELEKLPDGVQESWRSCTLNSLLVRAFYEVKDLDPKSVQPFVSPLKPLHVWSQFYHDIDVISTDYADLWDKLKPQWPGMGNPWGVGNF